MGRPRADWTQDLLMPRACVPCPFGFACTFARKRAKYDILQVLLKEEAGKLPTPEKARHSSGSVSRRQATSCEPTRIPTPGHLKSICNCKAIVGRNVGSFMTDGTVQETRMRFLFLCFCHRQSYSLFRDTRRGFLFVSNRRAGATRKGEWPVRPTVQHETGQGKLR